MAADAAESGKAAGEADGEAAAESGKADRASWKRRPRRGLTWASALEHDGKVRQPPSPPPIPMPALYASSYTAPLPAALGTAAHAPALVASLRHLISSTAALAFSTIALISSTADR